MDLAAAGSWGLGDTACALAALKVPDGDRMCGGDDDEWGVSPP
jgi:hypothetical protein